jgi:hypothetical protein
MNGYVLVRFKDEEVLPAVIDEPNQYLSKGTEVILADGEEAVCVSSQEGYADAERDVAVIAKLFHRDPEKLPRVAGVVYRTYWNKKDDPERDWRADA